MTHPNTDPLLRAIVGPRPSTDAVFCDECMRWELGNDGGHLRPARILPAHAFYMAASAMFRMGGRLVSAGDYIQAAYLVATGRGVSKGRSR